MKRTPKAPRTPKEQAAFTIEKGDRFHSILATDPIRYAQAPGTETFIFFFAIRRGSGGHIDMFNIMKRFEGNACCFTQSVPSKMNISESKIAAEIEFIKTHFTEELRAASGGGAISWNELDLSQVADIKEQVKRIQKWGRISVVKMPEIGLN